MTNASRAALVCLFLIPAAAPAQARIALSCRVVNRPPGRCGWCAVETLARHLGVRPLYGLTEDHACLANPDDLTAALDAARVRYHAQARGRRDTAVLRAASRDGLGAAVGFRPLVPGGGGHIVTLVEFGDDEVRVIDPNDQDGRVRAMTRDGFLHWWDGFALVLERPKP